jgi:hypothetical protein
VLHVTARGTCVCSYTAEVRLHREFERDALPPIVTIDVVLHRTSPPVWKKVDPMSATAVTLHEQAVGLTFLRQAYRRSSLHMAGMTFGGAESSRLHDRGRLEIPVFCGLS